MGFITRNWEVQTWGNHLEEIWGLYFEKKKGLKNTKEYWRLISSNSKFCLELVRSVLSDGHLKWLLSKNLAGLDKQASDQIMKSTYLCHCHMLLSNF